MQRRGWKIVSQTKRDRENHASNWKTGWFAISCNSIRFFAYAWQSLSMMEISRKSRLLFHGSKSPKDVRCQSALHLAISLSFTDTSMKMDALSVNLNEILAESVEQYCCLKKVVFIHWELKVPDKVSRKSTVFVRLFVKFKTEKRLFPSLFVVVKPPKW